MRSWMIAFSAGIFVAGFIPRLPDSDIHLLFLLPLLASLFYSRLRLLGAFCLGLFWLLHWALQSQEKLLPLELEREDIWVQGKVSSLPQHGDRNLRFNFTVEQLCPRSVLNTCDFETLAQSKQQIQLNLYEQDVLIEPGQSWRLKVRLRRPHGFANPGGFDYEAWLWQQKISATGYIRNDPGNRMLAESQRKSFDYLRYQFRVKLEQLFPPDQERALNNIGLIKALTIGERNDMSNEEWELFSGTGTNHLVVISGLHVGLMALLLYQLAILLLSRITVLNLLLPVRRSAALFALIAAFCYAGMAGFTLPALRAFIMLAAFMLGQIFCRQTHVYNSWCLALALVLLVDPLAPQNSGFWLSFAAVGVLIYFVPREYNQQAQPFSILRKVWLLFKVQGLVFIGLFPAMLFLFQQTSLLAPLVNLFAIPFISLLVVPLCLFGLLSVWIYPDLALHLFKLADLLLSGFKAGLSFSLNLWPQALLALPALSLSLWLCLLAGIVLLLYSFRTAHAWFLRMLGLACFALLLLPGTDALKTGEFKLTVLDVGQGLALHISTENHELIYDSGPNYSTRFNAGADVLIPYLRASNIRQVDKVIISHGDNDHAGGLQALIDEFPAAAYFASDAETLAAVTQKQLCRQGEGWHWDGVDFMFLHPDSAFYRPNNSSCVLRVSNGLHSILLTGDIERQAERSLLRDHDQSLKADILLAPHHGSRTSSTQAFIDAVSPAYVIFTAGYLNQFNHPHPQVVQGYTNSGTITLNTANSGAIRFYSRLDGSDNEPERYRLQHKRFWRNPEIKNPM